MTTHKIDFDYDDFMFNNKHRLAAIIKKSLSQFVDVSNIKLDGISLEEYYK